MSYHFYFRQKLIFFANKALSEFLQIIPGDCFQNKHCFAILSHNFFKIIILNIFCFNSPRFILNFSIIGDKVFFTLSLLYQCSD
jgi:hypothetical protein